MGGSTGNLWFLAKDYVDPKNQDHVARNDVVRTILKRQNTQTSMVDISHNFLLMGWGPLITSAGSPHLHFSISSSRYSTVKEPMLKLGENGDS